MADLSVSKKSIGKLFGEMQDRQFIIPDYQRPYKWNKEKCETLWRDLVDFAENDAKAGHDYFLGTVVTYTTVEGGNPEVIDGQQRITSLFLLLRAFYSQLQGMTQDAEGEVAGLKRQIEPCIWDTDDFSQKVSDFNKIHIKSLVATEEDKEAFHKILETGDVLNNEKDEDENDKDNYTRNYRFFRKSCKEYSINNTFSWKNLCVSIMKRCIILPIECSSQDTALTIFSTLNDRGMPLADSDIFKAQLYRNAGEAGTQVVFTERWKELTEVCKNSGQSVDDIFRFYTHVLRGRSGDKSKEVGLRKFYAHDYYARLKAAGVMDEIMELAKFWKVINKNTPPEDDAVFRVNTEARKYLHCLRHYPNEFWKYPVSVFFLKNAKSETFESDFVHLLTKLTAFLFARFLEAPTVNAIKDPIYDVCIALSKSNKLTLGSTINFDGLKQRMAADRSSRISRSLLLLSAYRDENQKDIIDNNFEIEHILPKKWQSANYNGWDKKDADLHLERLGNKVVFEKKLNIQAGNGYFGQQKRNKYKDSKIAAAKELSNHASNDWMKADIDARETALISILNGFFEQQLKAPAPLSIY